MDIAVSPKTARRRGVTKEHIQRDLGLRNNEVAGPFLVKPSGRRACLKTTTGPAARDFVCGQGGEGRASPQRAVRPEPTKATGKRPAARRVFEEKPVWLRCSSVRDRWRVSSLVASRHPSFSSKTGPLVVFKQARRLFCPGSLSFVAYRSMKDMLAPHSANQTKYLSAAISIVF